MTKTDFNKLISKLDSYISKLEAFQAETDKPQNTWTIQDINTYRNTSASMQSTMDKLLQADLYHIVGMGNLSGAQLSLYMKKVKQIGSYRAKIKWLACLPVITISELGEESEYTTHLGGLKLTAKNI